MKRMQIRNTLKFSEIEEIKNLSKEAFKNIGSENYKQKLIYNLLNTIRVNNQKEFFWILLRALNSNSKDKSSKELANKLKEIYPVSSGDFEKIAYSIILGIMATGGIENE